MRIHDIYIYISNSPQEEESHDVILAMSDVGGNSPPAKKNVWYNSSLHRSSGRSLTEKSMAMTRWNQ